MKTRKFLASSALALSMALTPAAAMLNALPVAAETVSVDGFGSNTHTFVAYQIFKGTQGANGVLGNIQWGDGVNSTGLLAAIETSNLTDLKGATSANELAEKLDKLSSDSETARAFAKLVDQNTSGPGTPVTTAGASLDAGYYLIKDTSTQTKEVVGLSILQLTGTTDGIKISPKNSHPTVDKEVEDVDGDSTAWGETADHDLNTPINFKLKSEGLTKDGIKAYDTYYLEFNDVLSEGLTFDSITSVKLGNKILTQDTDYTVTQPDTNANGGNLKVMITDLKTVTGFADATDINVTVEYVAHLNEKAVLNTTTGSIENKNYVELVYSNNPNGDGRGTSEKDYVFVASFQLTNTKKALNEDGDALAGAGFELWKGNQVAVFNNEHKFQKWVDASYVVTTGEVREIVSDENGDFSMYGLDAGVYTLKEVTTPDGYNTAADTTVTVNATHAEDTSKESATVTLTNDSSTSTTVVNTQNGTLPETGGMGTTMFYIAGSALVAGAAVIFVTNKRTRRN